MIGNNTNLAGSIHCLLRSGHDQAVYDKLQDAKLAVQTCLHSSTIVISDLSYRL